jgi:hypothetical protein
MRDEDFSCSMDFPYGASPFELSHFLAKLEGTDSDLDKILLICLDSQETAIT